MKVDAKPGDYIEIRTADSTYSGVLMPRPELTDNDHIVLKLDSGYNVGIALDEIRSVKKLGKKAELESFPARKIEKNPNLPSIDILGCGGTIASRIDYETGGVKWAMKPDEVFFTVPELKDIANVRGARLLFNIASESMTAKHWQEMAREVAKSLNSGARGVVLMHGTDTMHYSAAALSFMLKDISGPVVITGSQRSSDRGSSDSPQNLICATHLAAKSDLGEVVVCMHGSESDDFCWAHRGVKVRKMHTSRRDAFQSINASPLMKVTPKGEIAKLAEYRKAGGKTIADTKFEERVTLLKAYPGGDPGLIDYCVDKKFKGIVIEATGLGHVPGTWENSIQRAVEKGVAVVFAAQTLYGRLNPYVYEPARKMKDLGVIYAEDVLPEVAYVKLGWVLGHGLDPAKEMPKNYVGEISPRTEEKFGVGGF